MTYKEINTMLASIGLPYAYYQFHGTGTEPPFICFYYGDSDDVYADDTNYQRITNLTVEFYSDAKDFDNEALIEKTLSENGLTYQKSEQYIDTEKLHETIYEMEVLING